MVNFFCIGRNNVDIYADKMMVYPGGNCNNVAAHLAKCGQQVSLATVVGNDRLGKLQVDSLQKLGVNTAGIRSVEDQTAWCEITHSGKERIFVKSDLSIFENNPISHADAENVLSENYDVIYTSTCINGFFEAGVFDALGTYGLPVCCDFGDRWNENEIFESCKTVQYAYMSCQRFSEKETAAFLTECTNHGAVLALGTRGMDGAFVFDGTTLYRQQACTIPIVDTLGAGDSFLAMFSMCYFNGLKELKKITFLFPEGRETENAIREAKETLIRYSLNMASLYATSVCCISGGFGFGIPFELEMIHKGRREI